MRFVKSSEVKMIQTIVRSINDLQIEMFNYMEWPVEGFILRQSERFAQSSLGISSSKTLAMAPLRRGVSTYIKNRE
jgi:hypothetical protein